MDSKRSIGKTTLAPEVFSLSEVPQVQTSGEVKPNVREPLDAHVWFVEHADPIRSHFEVSKSKSDSSLLIDCYKFVKTTVTTMT